MAIGAASTPFPACCGATIFNNFSTGYTDIPEHKECHWSGYSFIQGHLYFAILKEHQVKEFEPTLLKSSFRLVSDNTVNKNTGNRLFVYLRDPVFAKPVTVAAIKSFFS
jgi:hypothetical protein